MKKTTACAALLVLVWLWALPAVGRDLSDDVDAVLAGIESRYGAAGFSLEFYQESTIGAMNITDTAHGKILIRPPAMMRWEYESPEKQEIITDGKQLWVYKPEENQVMKGSAPLYFGGGKGAGFLSNATAIREHFSVSLESREDLVTILLLTPKKQDPNLSRVYLWVSTNASDILRVITQNAYGDETRIDLSGFARRDDLTDDMFHFQIPKGADVVEME